MARINLPGIYQVPACVRNAAPSRCRFNVEKLSYPDARRKYQWLVKEGLETGSTQKDNIASTSWHTTMSMLPNAGMKTMSRMEQRIHQPRHGWDSEMQKLSEK